MPAEFTPQAITLLTIRHLPIPDQALADWDAMVRLAAWCDGHSRCGGVLLGRDAQRIACTCGTGYEITDPARAAA
jgi:hypothetical protein